MKHIISTILIMLTAINGALAQEIQRHAVNVGDFTSLRVAKAINVDYKSNPDSAGTAVFQAPVDLVNAIMFTNNGKGRLSIEIDMTETNTRQLPTVTVYSRFLTSIENLADSTVRAFNVNAGPKFKARLEGNGRLSLRGIDTDEVTAKVFTGRGQIAIDGRCAKASLSCTGPGSIQADQLTADNVNATLTGTGSIGCNPTTELTVKGTGPGTVYHTGEPEIKNRSIGCKIKKIGE